MLNLNKSPTLESDLRVDFLPHQSAICLLFHSFLALYIIKPLVADLENYKITEDEISREGDAENNNRLFNVIVQSMLIM